MVSLSVLLAASAGLAKFGAAIGASIAVIGAAFGIGKSEVKQWNLLLVSPKQPTTFVPI